MKDSIIYKQTCCLLHTLFNEKGVIFSDIDSVDLVDDLSIDSILFVSMIVEIENMFNISIDDELLVIANFRNIEKIVAIINNQLRDNGHL